MKCRGNQLGNQKVTCFLTNWLPLSDCQTIDKAMDNQSNPLGRVEREYVWVLVFSAILEGGG